MLELGTLNVVCQERRYGYDIVRRLRQIEGPVRTSIEESQEGPPRKYYELSDAGGEILTAINGY